MKPCSMTIVNFMLVLGTLRSVLVEAGVGTQIYTPRGDSPLGTPRTLDVNRTGIVSIFSEEGRAVSNVLLGVYKDEECRPDLGFTRFEEADFDKGGPSALRIVKASWQDTLHVLGSCDTVAGLEACASVLYVPRGGNCDSIDVGPATADGVRRVVGANEGVQIEFANHCDHAVDLLWVDERGDERMTSLGVQPGRKITQNTFLGHVFCARHSKTNELMDWFQVDTGGIRSLVCAEPAAAVENEDEVCLEGTGACTQDVNAEEGLRDFLWHKEWQNRLALNRIQPKLVRNLTDVGFEKRRIPDDLLETLQSFLNSNSARETTETSAGPVMNQQDVSTYMTHLGTRERTSIVDVVKPVLEEWSNLELKMTSLYGIRKYVDGAVLEMHVDTGNTHVVSAIINVDQNVREDWKLEIMDLAGIVHEVAMIPGDMVLYESAKVLHGRPVPLNGEFYANVFLHYMPTKGWDFQMRL